VSEGEWVRGVRLGVDVGTVRVGVAISDPDGILATPLVTLRRDLSTPSKNASEGEDEGEDSYPEDIAAVMRLVQVHETVEVVVGLPVTLSGQESHAATHVRAYAQVLARAVAPVPVRLTDERMSTAVATRRLSERGVRGGRRRAVVDQAAAVEILQGWLDAARRRRDA
jgi:putative Holliday junction resolvase